MIKAVISDFGGTLFVEEAVVEDIHVTWNCRIPYVDEVLRELKQH